MDRSSYGNTAAIIGQITDVNQLMAMMKQPQYAGFTPVIIARITEIKHLQGAAQGAQPQQPTVAQQAIQGIPEQQPQQMMARGGIIAFKDGGKVQGYADGHKVKGGKEVDPYWVAADAAPTLGTGLYDLANAPGNIGAPSWAQPSQEDVGRMIGAQPKSPIPGLAVSHYGADITPASQQAAPSAARRSGTSPDFVPFADFPKAMADSIPPEQVSISSGGRASSRISGGGGRDYEKFMEPKMSLEDAYARQQALEGPDDSMPTYKAERAKQRADIESQKGNLLNEALMRTGASMMSSRSPYFLSSAGEGIIGGLEGYTKGRGEINAAERAGTKEDLMAGNIARQEKIGGIRAAQSAVTANQTQRLGVLKDMAMQDRYLAQLNVQADKAASAGNNQALAATVRELGDLHKAALSTTAQAQVNMKLADPTKGGSPEEYLAAKQAYAVAQRNETNLANAIMQHAGGRGIQSLQALNAVNPADPNNFYTTTPQGKVRAPLSVGR